MCVILFTLNSALNGIKDPNVTLRNGLRYNENDNNGTALSYCCPKVFIYSISDIEERASAIENKEMFVANIGECFKFHFIQLFMK